MLPSLYLYVYHILWYLKCTGKVTYISRRDWILCNLFPWINSNKKKGKKKVTCVQVLSLVTENNAASVMLCSGRRDGIVEALAKLPFRLESVTFQDKAEIICLKVSPVSEVRTLPLDLNFCKMVRWISWEKEDDLVWQTQDFDLTSFRTVLSLSYIMMAPGFGLKPSLNTLFLSAVQITCARDVGTGKWDLSSIS